MKRGVKCTHFNFTWWPWKHSWFKEAEVRPKVWSRPHLRTHLTNEKWKPCARFTCTWSSSKILMNGGIQLVLQAFLLCQQVWSHAFYRATFPSALKSSSYLKLTSLLVCSQQLLTLKPARFRSNVGKLTLSDSLTLIRNAQGRSLKRSSLKKATLVIKNV